LATKPWGQREFSLLDPDHNLLTFGETVIWPLKLVSPPIFCIPFSLLLNDGTQ
jgi:hypothetical protein